MKLGKIILPALLAFGLVGGLAASNENKVEETSAMSTVLYDEDMDVGINVTASADAEADWTISTFYVNNFESVDVSGGDYFAFRMRSNNGGASYFDFIPNVGGNAVRVPISPAATGIKCIPAVNGGVAFDYGGARTWDLPMNFWADADVWFCIPKASLTRNLFGGAPNWNDNIWAIYFMFYGTTIDNVNFDIGNIWTANIDGDGHLQKVNRILNWANFDALGVVNDSNMDLLTVTRNNPNLRKAVRLIQNIEYGDACDATASEGMWSSSYELYDSLDSGALAYLDNFTIYDYASGDTAHSGGRSKQWSASQKWAQIKEVSGHGSSPARYAAPAKKNKTLTLVIVITSVTSLSAVGLILISRKRRLEK